MRCLDRIKLNLVTHEVLLKTTNLYYEMGKNHYYQQLLKSDLEQIKLETAHKNAENFFKLFFSDFTIRDSRFRTLLLDSSTPNNQAEHLYRNLVEIFRKIHVEANEPFNLLLGEIQDLTRILFNNVLTLDKLKYRSLGKKKGALRSEASSVREELETYLEAINKNGRKKEIEPVFLFVNFFVDFINMEVFNLPYNESIGILIFYILILENNFDAANYVSFFKKLYLYKQEYQEIIRLIKMQNKQDVPDLMPLMRFFIDIFNSMYVDLEEFSRDYKYDQDLSINKTDYIENTILKLPEVFSKADIRKKHPSVSDSTINRTLSRLQENDVIRSIGSGRSAKWVRIVQKTKKQKFDGRMLMDSGEKYE